MKTIVCFGDSNTWGYDPVSQQRFPRDVRWTGILRNSLGEGYLVVEEGLNGRTTVWDDPIEGYKNGRTYLVPCLETHRPFDVLVIMLGTNDLKGRFSLSALDIANGAGVLVQEALRSDAGIDGQPPKVLLIAPPPTASLKGTLFGEMFVGAEQKSSGLAVHYLRVAEQMGCAFLNAGDVIVSSPLDGIHFEAGEHRKLGEAIAAKVRELIAE